MKKNVEIFLDHILESIDLIQEYKKDKEKSDFLKSKQLQDFVIRRIEIIGDAIKIIPSDFKGRYEHIPWKETTRMRDILIQQ